MPSDELLNLIATLSTDQQRTVESFIIHLKKQAETPITFRKALDSFVREHPDLLCRLAQ